MTVLSLDFLQTLALAAVVLFAGYGIKARVGVLDRYNIPAPVVGGFLFALLSLALRGAGLLALTFDTLLQTPLMIAFFTTIGFGASVALLRTGGPLVLLFFVVSSLAAVVQNLLGVAIALPLGEHPLLGVLAGSVTLTGGPATGLAFAPEFERAGVPSAAVAAVAAAMVGIVAGGLIGGPIGTWLLGRGGRAVPHRPASETAANAAGAHVADAAPRAPRGEDVEAYVLLKHITLVLAAMALGALLSLWLTRYLTLPAYIGAMLVAAALRNLDDATGLFASSQRVIDDLGTVVLSLFLTMALMTLPLWQLAGLAVPLAIILFGQVVLVGVLAALVIYRLAGRDYEAAVMASGFCGFMLGTTANAMANMEALAARYGPAPKAFLVVPMVGAFFIDFTNALIITAFLNVWR